MLHRRSPDRLGTCFCIIYAYGRLHTNRSFTLPVKRNYRRAVAVLYSSGEDRSSASVVNHTIVTDPTIRQPGFHLPRHTWSLMSRFPCRVNLHKWGLTQSPSCDCGQRQTMNHTVDRCPLTTFEGGLNLLHEAEDGAVMWLESTATAALTKQQFQLSIWSLFQILQVVPRSL